MTHRIYVAPFYPEPVDVGTLRLAARRFGAAYTPLHDDSTLSDLVATADRGDPGNVVVIGLETDIRARQLTTIYTWFPWSKSVIYLTGSTNAGIPEELRVQCDLLVEVETLDRASIGPGLAAGIVLYEHQRMLSLEGRGVFYTP